MTKNKSTPTKPPGKYSGKAWKITTDTIAIVLNPSISAL